MPIPPKPSVKDRQRWYLWRSEKPMEEIAAREKTDVANVRASIDRVESYRFLVSIEEVDLAYNAMALELVDDEKRVLKQAMRAKTWRTANNGKEVPIVDHKTRLSAIEIAREFTNTVRPKTPMIQNNVQNNVNGGVNGGGGMSFEQRLREIKARRMAGELGNGPPLLEARTELSQAERIAEELEEAGIDLEDGDLAELGDEELDSETA